MLLLGIIVGLIILMLLVAAHEFGHGVVARRNGVVVEEFSIGFPPEVASRKIKKSVLGKNVKYTLSWLPLGGFVKLKGEHDSASKSGDYGAANYWQKTRILLAGIAVNWVIAVILFTGLALVGLPKLLPHQFSVAGDTTTIKRPLQVSYVESGSPAETSGIKAGDEVLRINGRLADTAETLSGMTKQYRGQAVELVYKQAGVEKIATATLRATNTDGKGYFGVSTREREELQSTWSAPIVGVGVTVQFTAETFKGLGKMLGDIASGLIQKLSSNKETQEVADAKLASVSQSVTGPVGILGVIFPQAQQAGIKTLVLITAVISLSLAVMNVLPIPALDGGRWFLMTVYRLRRKPLTKEIEEKFQLIGFVCLMALVILVTIADVAKF